MSESESFLSRWARLKREADSAGGHPDDKSTAVVLPQAREPAATVFDPASLPPLESIDAASDIRPFLEACVPPELTRAALRSAWSADPAIRDFVGIAENQWDFNDHTAIAGFGLITAADYAQSLAARTCERLNDAVVSQKIPVTVSGSESARPDPDDPEIAAAVEDAAAIAAHSPGDVDLDSESVVQQLPHRHGSALPQ